MHDVSDYVRNIMSWNMINNIDYEFLDIKFCVWDELRSPLYEKLILNLSININSNGFNYF